MVHFGENWMGQVCHGERSSSAFCGGMLNLLHLIAPEHRLQSALASFIDRTHAVFIPHEALVMVTRPAQYTATAYYTSACVSHPSTQSSAAILDGRHASITRRRRACSCHVHAAMSACMHVSHVRRRRRQRIDNCHLFA